MKSQDNHQRRRKFLKAARLSVAATALAPALLGRQAEAEATTAAPSSVSSLRDLRASAKPLVFTMCLVAGHHKAGDGGGGTFYWDSAFLPPQSQGDPAARIPPSVLDTIPDDGGTYLLPNGHPPHLAGRWRRVFDGALNPRWFGALGDNTGRTPSDDGVDIQSASWNRWPRYLTVHKSNTPRFFGFDIASAPFSNTDSWDWIGLQLALFSVGETQGEVAVSGGIYQLTKTLFLANGMRATLSGAGMYQSILTKKPGHFAESSILYLYRTGGTPLTIRSLCFTGPFGGGQAGFTLITQNNTNGVHLQDCWLTTCQTGVHYFNNCSDSFVRGCTAEFCTTVLDLDLDTKGFPSINDQGSDVTVEGCNFWQSAKGASYTGISVKGGQLQCTGSRFIGFNNASIAGVIGTDHSGRPLPPVLFLTGNHFLGFHCSGAALSGDGRAWVVSGNRFVGSAEAFIAAIPDQSSFTGNYVEITNRHACLNIGEGAKHTTVTGNTFLNSSGQKTIEGGLIISVKQGVSYAAGCSHCVISGNSCGAIPASGTSGINVDTSAASGNVVVNNIIS